MSKVIRSVKNVTKGYSAAQVKVRDATSNDPWGPTGTQMGQIAQMTYGTSTEFYEIMDMLDKRLNDKGKNWRHVLKALKVMDYILHEGSEMVVTWAKQNIFVIKTLREFMYIDEDGKDVGNNGREHTPIRGLVCIRVAAKDLTALLLDEERLREERTDRRAWKSRMQYGEEMPQHHAEPSRPRPRQHRAQYADEDDAEYKLAIEASKYQEEEDRKRRERALAEVDDDDLAKAIKLSKEEEERRRRELEETNASALFDDTPAQTTQPQFTGFNQGYQQGSAVDFFANPLDQNQLQAQQTAYMNNAFTGYGQQPMGYQQTGYQNGFQNGFQPQPTGMYDPYGQQQQQQQPQGFMSQPTGYNPYSNQQQQQQQPQFDNSSSTLQPGSNNPWASNNNNQQSSALKPAPTGSNNPFAQKSPYKAPSMPALSSLPEQKTLSTFPQISVTSSNSPFNTFGSQSQQQQQQPQQQQPQFQQQPQQPQRELSEHEQKLNALLASGDGMDTFGNTGNLRIPAQHTAPGTFVNSAGAGLNRITAEATGNNPFLKQQFTGMPTVSYGGQQMPAATGPAGMGMNVGFGGYQQQQMGNSNPFAAGGQQQQRQQQGGGGDLISF
ncbi:ENTH domain-containing protein [Neurospora tetraspora]|uniref:ENTH domain-containing protein n=1 Tax=Neurospora tetraspora TaxID=94610 RepID=A0AAE0JC69_9PEZI|nr:ENTH domain-containing protein [Neurospora tetraspora]